MHVLIFLPLKIVSRGAFRSCNTLHSQGLAFSVFFYHPYLLFFVWVAFLRVFFHMPESCLVYLIRLRSIIERRGKLEWGDGGGVSGMLVDKGGW